jgi:multicomponent K+:H+ antiporter subunit D
MLVLTGVVGVCAALYAEGAWARAGVYFHPLFQIQLMGLNGAFLTADLFNLFVFFEVLLAASYGLLLHGSGRSRVRSGLHYVAVNLLASSLFLIGVAILYGITGTLNLADMAHKVPLIAPADRGLLHAGAAILGMAFLIKAAMWPLNFWLVPTYAAASAPAGAVFVILTKVGVYAVLRLWTLLLSAEAGWSALFGSTVLVYGGFATLAFASIGLLASQQVRRLAGFSIMVSSGTLLAAIGFAQAPLIGGALFYLLGSIIAGSALFLVGELVERSREGEDAQVPIHSDEADHLPFYLEGGALDGAEDDDDDDQALIGRPIPAAMAFIGLAFVTCALIIAGLPPLSGFLAKFAMLDALLMRGTGAALGNGGLAPAGWMLLTLLIASGMLATLALSRAGIRYFWAPAGRSPPRLRMIEGLPIAALLLIGAGLAIFADPVLRYARVTAEGLLEPALYVDAVMSARPVPGPARHPLDALNESSR